MNWINKIKKLGESIKNIDKKFPTKLERSPVPGQVVTKVQY